MFYVSSAKSKQKEQQLRRLVVLENIAAQYEGKEQLVLFKEGTADVAVEVVGEVVGQVPQATFQDLGLITAGDDRWINCLTELTG